MDEIEAKLLKDQRVFLGKLLDENEKLEEDSFSKPLGFASTTTNSDSEDASAMTSPEDTSDREEFRKWYEKYQTLKDEPLSSKDRKKHMQWLFRYALAEEEEGGKKKYKKYHFSYCCGEWFADYDLFHCSDCRTCRHSSW